jgi:hypothetical protein
VPPPPSSLITASAAGASDASPSLPGFIVAGEAPVSAWSPGFAEKSPRSDVQLQSAKPNTKTTRSNCDARDIPVLRFGVLLRLYRT